MLAVRIIKHRRIDGAIIDKRTRHVPIRHDHAVVSTLVARQHVKTIPGALRTPHYKPIASLAHDWLAPQLIQFKNQISIFVFTHLCSPVAYLFLTGWKKEPALRQATAHNRESSSYAS